VNDANRLDERMPEILRSEHRPLEARVVSEWLEVPRRPHQIHVERAALLELGEQPERVVGSVANSVNARHAEERLHPGRSRLSHGLEGGERPIEVPVLTVGVREQEPADLRIRGAAIERLQGDDGAVGVSGGQLSLRRGDRGRNALRVEASRCEEKRDDEEGSQREPDRDVHVFLQR
jgi:hypothetical protein